MKKFSIALVFLFMLAGGVTSALYYGSKVQREQTLRFNQALAVRNMPANSTGPVRAAEAKAALRGLSTLANASAVAVAYQQEGQFGFGCVVATEAGIGVTPRDKLWLSVAEACQQAGAQYLKDQAERKKRAAAPSFYKSPFLASVNAARTTLPEGTIPGDAAAVLPLLDQAKFEARQKVAIMSYRSAADESGCVLAGEMGVFRATGYSEATACAKVIGLAKAVDVRA